MTLKRYGLTGGLSTDDLKNILEEILGVLRDIGVEVDHAEVLALLAGKKGITVKGKRVCFDPGLVKEFIPQIKAQNAEYSYNRKGSDRFRMVGPYMSRYYVGIDTGDVHLATREECVQAVKLCDTYDMYGSSPVHLQEIPVHLRQLATEKICLENSREIGGFCFADNIRETEFLCRMGRAAGRKPPYCAMEIPISPLRLNHTCLDIIYRNRDRQYNLDGICLGGGAAPMPGASAPIFYPAMLVQGMAEALAAYITPKLIDPEVYGYCSFGGFLFDLKTMQISKPFPESVLYNMASGQVIHYVLGETFGICLSGSLENREDIFRTAFAAGLGIAAGATTVLGIGGDSSGAAGAKDIFNPVQAVIQADIVRHCERFARGFPYHEEKGISRQVIEEGIFTGMPNSFLDHETTLGYREIYLDPELFFKYSGAELTNKAREVAKKRIAEHAFALPADKQEAIEAIYREADQVLGAKHD